MAYLSEHAAWTLLHETIAVRNGALMVNSSGNRLIGLCSAVMRLRCDLLIGMTTEDRMLARIRRAVYTDRGPSAVYLTRPECWSNGVRLEYALRFAQETAP